MRIINPSIRVLAASGYEPPEVPFSYTVEPELLIEYAGRTCHNSRNKIAPGTAKEFVNRLWRKGHRSVWEHSWSRDGYYCGNARAFREGSKLYLLDVDCCMLSDEQAATFNVVTDRGVMAEFTRHRTMSFSVRSTRYVAEKPGDMEFVRLPWAKDKEYDGYRGWEWSIECAEESYHDLIQRCGWRPEQARSILPNSLATEMVVTAHLGSWRHFCALRAAPAAHPQMRQVAIPILGKLKRLFPLHFEDFETPEVNFELAEVK